jgi:hypothetical protein
MTDPENLGSLAKHQSSHDCMLRVRVDATSRTSQIEGIPKQRCARRFFERQRRAAKERTICVR